MLPEGEHRDALGPRRPDHLRARAGRGDGQPRRLAAARAWSTRTATSASPRAAAHVEDLAAAREQALTERAAGVLALRDCGSPVDTRALDDEPDLPRIIRAGRHIAAPRRYIPGLAVEVEPRRPGGRGPRAGPARRRLGEARRRLDRPRASATSRPSGRATSLEAAIAAAHDEGARVTAHTFGTDALPDLIGAGIDCIEHGTGLTEELIGEMAARGTAVVPTLVNVENFPGFAAAGEKKFPAYASTMRRLYASSGAVVRAAFEAGVPVFAGTDAGGGIEHGVIADEVRALHAAGLPAEAALAAASWSARELARPAVHRGGGARRPRRLRHRPARRPRRATATATDAAARPRRRLSRARPARATTVVPAADEPSRSAPPERLGGAAGDVQAEAGRARRRCGRARRPSSGIPGPASGTTTSAPPAVPRPHRHRARRCPPGCARRRCRAGRPRRRPGRPRRRRTGSGPRGRSTVHRAGPPPRPAPTRSAPARATTAVASHPAPSPSRTRAPRLGDHLVDAPAERVDVVQQPLAVARRAAPRRPAAAR